MNALLEHILKTDEYCLDILDVAYYKRDRRLDISLSSPSLLLPMQEKHITAELKKLLPQNSDLTLSICYCNINESVISDFDSTADTLKDILADVFFELRPFIGMSVWELDSETVIIRLPERYTTLFNKPLEYLKSRYGLTIPFSVTADDSIEYEYKHCGTDSDVLNAASMPQKKAHPIQITPKKPKEDTPVWGRPINSDAKIVPMRELRQEMKSVVTRGRIVPMTKDEKDRKNTDRLKRVITDDDSAITLYAFTKTDDKKPMHSFIDDAEKRGLDLIVRGKVYYDERLEEYCLLPYDMVATPPVLRQDTAEQKRVELHLHTQMSEMDAIVSPEAAIKTAARWGHKAVAITDHGVVHAFPDAMLVAEKAGIKLIFGVEGYLYDDCELVPTDEFYSGAKRYVAFSATMVSAGGADNFFEVSVWDINSGEHVRLFINPGVPLTREFTTVTRDDVASAPPMSDVLPNIAEFLDGARVVTHDKTTFLKFCALSKLMGYDIDKRYIDTGLLTHYLHDEVEDCTDLRSILSHINGGNAIPDNYAQATAELFRTLIDELSACSAPLPVMHGETRHKRGKRLSYYHIILLAGNRCGLKNIYRMVTFSHAENFSTAPLIPRSLFAICRDGVILGSACERGELFRAVIAQKDDATLYKIASWYDFLEIQPIGNNAFMIRNGTAKDEEHLRDFNRKIVSLGETLGKPVVATGDVHFLNPEDDVYRKVIMHTMHFKDAEQQAPLYFKTTDEMLEEFSYLGEEKAFEVVVKNPNIIADSCETLRAYLDERKTYAPVFDGAEDELKNMADTAAEKLYGGNLPDIVRDRLDFELSSIINNGYATLYMMAQKLVYKSMSDGYLVGSRGSVGSSFVAYLAGITEVNPLPAHYVCPDCKNTEFVNAEYACGIDMPKKVCPVCGAEYRREGFDIPFEVFLGFKGDKTPDIDLNFSGEYQWRAHNFTREMFGDGHAFRAGVISTLKDKTAFGYVKAYSDDNGLDLTSAEMARLAMGCVGVKKTTGQHAGGIVIVPEDFEATDFMPLQYPANKKEGNRLITHFDYHALHDKLVKLDILGHDDPTALKMMNDLTDVNPQDIPLDDPETLSLFSTDKALGVNLEKLGIDVGVLGIPEYGTQFVRKILEETRPTTIEELVRIAGLSHGTDVWTGNAQTLIKDGKASLSQVICTRDDIMTYLINCGCESLMAFKIMESVRKGKGLTAEMEAAMNVLELPSWYIPSCKKIQYMFPRAHAAAYLTMAFRVAYYKMHYPLVFYAIYLTVRADDFNILLCGGGADTVLDNIKKIEKRIQELESWKNRGTPAKYPELEGMTVDKLKKLLPILEVVYEMNLRGIELQSIDINRSRATEFQIDGSTLIPPFNSLQGLGSSLAMQMCEAQKKVPNGFSSIDEFKTLSGASNSIISKLESLGCFEGLVKSNQMSLLE